jgi:hypothetical protein
MISRASAPHHLIKDQPIRTSALHARRYANVFAIESFMDELAAAAGSIRSRFVSRTRATRGAGGDRGGRQGGQLETG